MHNVDNICVTVCDVAVIARFVAEQQWK